MPPTPAPTDRIARSGLLVVPRRVLLRSRIAAPARPRSSGPACRAHAAGVGLLAAIAAVAAWFQPCTAGAEQRELQLGLQPVYGITYIDKRTPSGGGGNLQLSYGITDAVGIQLHGGITDHPLSEDKDDMLAAGTLLTWHASLGVVYSLDIVRIVPYFEASIGLLGVTTMVNGMTKTSLNAGAELGLGGDYMLNRRWAVGVAVRYHAFLTDLGRIPLYLTVGPRVLLRFGL